MGKRDRHKVASKAKVMVFQPLRDRLLQRRGILRGMNLNSRHEHQVQAANKTPSDPAKRAGREMAQSPGPGRPF
jgi:hypothetical protein